MLPDGGAKNQPVMPKADLGQDFIKEVEDWIKKAKASIKDFDKKDRRKILTKAALPVTRTARKVIRKKYKHKESSRRKHYRNSNGQRFTYTPGNLRRSLKRIPLRRTPDAFIGPTWGKGRGTRYGGVGQPTDGYYAAAWAGNSKKFKSIVLAPAANQERAKVVTIVKNAAIAAIVKHAALRGIKTR